MSGLSDAIRQLEGLEGQVPGELIQVLRQLLGNCRQGIVNRGPVAFDFPTPQEGFFPGADPSGQAGYPSWWDWSDFPKAGTGNPNARFPGPAAITLSPTSEFWSIGKSFGVVRWAKVTRAPVGEIDAKTGRTIYWAKGWECSDETGYDAKGPERDYLVVPTGGNSPDVDVGDVLGYYFDRNRQRVTVHLCCGEPEAESSSSSRSSSSRSSRSLSSVSSLSASSACGCCDVLQVDIGRIISGAGVTLPAGCVTYTDGEPDGLTWNLCLTLLEGDDKHYSDTFCEWGVTDSEQDCPAGELVTAHAYVNRCGGRFVLHVTSTSADFWYFSTSDDVTLEVLTNGLSADLWTGVGDGFVFYPGGGHTGVGLLGAKTNILVICNSTCGQESSASSVSSASGSPGSPPVVGSSSASSISAPSISAPSTSACDYTGTIEMIVCEPTMSSDCCVISFPTKIMRFEDGLLCEITDGDGCEVNICCPSESSASSEESSSEEPSSEEPSSEEPSSEEPSSEEPSSGSSESGSDEELSSDEPSLLGSPDSEGSAGSEASAASEGSEGSATSESSAAYDCSTLSPDESAQHNMTLAYVSGHECDCDSGSHEGSYGFTTYNDTETRWEWVNASTCDYEIGGGESFATITVFLKCLPSGKWGVYAQFYELPSSFLQSDNMLAFTETELTLDGNDKFVGSVTLPMYNFLSVEQCQITLTWSA